MKIKKNFFDKRGFNLIELLIVLGLIGLITQMVFAFYFYSNKVFTVASEQSSVQQNIRIIADYITEELRNVESISGDEDEIKDFEKYYALKLRSEGNKVYLVKETIEFSNKMVQKKVGNSLTSLLFYPGKTPNTLIMIIKDQDFQLESRILLNSIEAINVPKEGIAAIYYSKYN